MNSKRRDKPLLFVLPGSLLLLSGTGIIVACGIAGRLDAAHALWIPIGMATAAIGAMVLTRTLLATFFLFIYALTALIIVICQQGFTTPIMIPFIVLLGICLPMAKFARK